MEDNPIRVIDKCINDLRKSLREYVIVEVGYRKDVVNQPFRVAQYHYFKYLHESGLYDRLLDCVDAMVEKLVKDYGADPEMATSIVGIDIDVEIFNAFDDVWNSNVGNENHQHHK
jgi:hypothetical protein